MCHPLLNLITTKSNAVINHDIVSQRILAATNYIDASAISGNITNYLGTI